MVVRRLLLAVLLALVWVPCASAQFLGFTSPQTITQTAFSAEPCANAPTSFTVRNIGQSVHYLVYSTSGTVNSLEIQIEGSQDNVTYYRMSDTGTGTSSGAVFASFYNTYIRVRLVACSGTGTVSAIYSGTSVATGSPVGLFGLQYSKELANDVAANATATSNVPLPRGGTGGVLYLTFSDATCASSTLALTAGPDPTQQITLLAATALSATANTQAFTIPAIAANDAVVTYTTGCGASAATYDLTYTVGDRIQATATISGTAGTGASPFACTNRAEFEFTHAGADQTQILAVPTTANHICHISLSLSASTDLTIVEGTGSDCATGTADLTGAYQNITTLALDFGWWASLNTTGAQAVCLETSGATTLGGVVIYADF